MANAGSAGRVFDGTKWEDANVSGLPDSAQDHPGSDTTTAGIGNGEIFVSVASYRDGKRCGSTLKALFDKASDPTKIVAGVIEQNQGTDPKCVIEYCKLRGVEPGRGGGEKDGGGPMNSPALRSGCPHYDRIRYVAVYDIAAKGPSYARSLGRKVLGDEEYCMQVDAHTDFTRNWDDVAREEWLSVGNEYGVLSTQPADARDRSDREPGGSRSDDVPRQCRIEFGQNGVPMYANPADGYAHGIARPLLGRTWSAAFSFAKCHLEENAPYDNFAPQLFDAEQFPRFARFWTRGYDVYTPTRNVAYHDFEPTDGVDKLDWAARGYPDPKAQRERALKRVRTLLQIAGGDDSPEAQANLGIYGLGRRRTMRQLQDFVGIDLIKRRGNSEHMSCGTLSYVPPDPDSSPGDNLYDRPNDLDPQPFYPLRTVYGRHRRAGRPPPPGEEAAAAAPVGVAAAVVGDADTARRALEGPPDRMWGDDRSDPAGTSAPAATLAALWLFGLFVWYAVFVSAGGGGGARGGGGGKGGARTPRRKRGAAVPSGGDKDH